MARWEFKTLSFDACGKQVFSDLSVWQKERIDSYVRALETAKKSPIASPVFSNYYVREGVGIAGGEIFPAGNLEYGFCQALHAEEFAVAVLRLTGNDSIGSEIILGIIAGKPGEIVTPCGNCRDIMLEYFSQTAEIVSGSSEGGLAVVAKLGDYLYESFDVVPENAENPHWGIGTVKQVLHHGKKIVNNAYFLGPFDCRNYYAMINAFGSLYYGAHDVMCDYHPIYALHDAVRQARRDHHPHFDHVMIVCENDKDEPPHVMYKDRQHLLEMNLQGELLSDKERDPIVYLATYNPKSGKTALWKTSVKKWLPLPFSPRNFGPEFVVSLKRYYKNIAPC